MCFKSKKNLTILLNFFNLDGRIFVSNQNFVSLHVEMV